MTAGMLQWVAIVVEFGGLLLIAIELYSPRTSARLRDLFDETQPRIRRRPAVWIGSFILTWILAVVMLTMWDAAMSMVANVVFSVLTILVLVLMGISRLFVRLGVVLGRGNSVGGVGLVMALIGFSIEVLQLIMV